MVVSFSHDENISVILSRCPARDDRSTDSRFRQPENILSVLVKAVVVKTVVAPMVVRFRQARNISYIFVAALVSKVDKSRLARARHPENMAEKLVTADVLKALLKLIPVRSSQL